MTPDDAVRNFRDALIVGYASWHRSVLAALTHERGFLDEAFGDWAQALWELLVERALLDREQYLEIYRAGSDYEVALHSRVFFHSAQPTHSVCVCGAQTLLVTDVLSGTPVNPADLEFDGFMAFTGTWFEETPPFDHVLLTSGRQGGVFLVPAEEVRFVMKALPQS